MCVCAVQLGVQHEALQKLVDVLPEVKHKVRSTKPAELGTMLQEQRLAWENSKSLADGVRLWFLETEVKGWS